MKIDGVFSGGGVKAYAFMGALKSIEENNLQLERVAGTSAGAIVASFIAASYRTDEINQLLQELDLQQFLDPPQITKMLPFSKWFFLYFQMGIYKGDKFEKWLHTKLAQKGVYTFNDLKPGYLKVVISDLTLGKLVVIPDDLKRLYNIEPENFLISKAIRMSAGFPYFFMPVKLSGKSKEKNIVVDGGLLSNFPLWIFENDHGNSKRPILGIKLSSSTEKSGPKKINNAFDMFHALFSTMKLAHDARYVSKSKENHIVFIPIENIDTINMHITKETKESLINLGKESTDKFLAHWPN